jgi:hypothetical protein
LTDLRRKSHGMLKTAQKEREEEKYDLLFKKIYLSKQLSFKATLSRRTWKLKRAHYAKLWRNLRILGHLQ